MSKRAFLIFIVLFLVILTIYLALERRSSSVGEVVAVVDNREYLHGGSEKVETAGDFEVSHQQVGEQQDLSIMSSQDTASEMTEILEEKLSEDEQLEIARLEEMMNEVRNVNQQCEEKINQSFHDPRFIDPRSEFYQDPHYILNMFNNLSEIIGRASVDGTYQQMQEMLSRDIAFDPLEFNQNTLELSGCLSPRLESFMMSAVDAMFFHEYDQETKLSLVQSLFDSVLSTEVVNAKGLLSLSFQLNALRLVDRMGVLENSYTDVISELISEMMEDHRALSEVLYGNSTHIDNQARRREISADFHKREIIREELNQIINQMRRELSQ